MMQIKIMYSLKLILPNYVHPDLLWIVGTLFLPFFSYRLFQAYPTFVNTTGFLVFAKHNRSCSLYAGERSRFANMTKALNRLKAKLLVVERECALDVNKTEREAVRNEMVRETRRYIFHPHKMVEDVATGIQLADLNSVLNGDIEPLIRAHVSQRRGREIVGADAL